MRSRAGKRVAVALGIACAALGVWAFSSWDRLAVEYHLIVLKARPTHFDDLLLAPEGSYAHQALERHLGTEAGRQALFRAFANEVLGGDGTIPDTRNGLLGVGHVYPRRSLEELESALVWIGPNVGGPPFRSERLMIHLMTVRRPEGYLRTIPLAVGDGMGRLKALAALLLRLRGMEFELAGAPSLRFRFLSGDEARKDRRCAWYREDIPSDQGWLTVCLAYRPQID